MPTSTLSGEAEWPQVAGAVIEAKSLKSLTPIIGFGGALMEIITLR
jgi:hypothetical protein